MPKRDHPGDRFYGCGHPTTVLVVAGARMFEERKVNLTELIVALDGPEPLRLLLDIRGIGVSWFKVGPLTLTDPISVHSIEALLPFYESLGLRMFYDAKLADHGPFVCGELAKRLGEKGYAALSTSTDEATEAAVRAAEGSPLRVWRHVAPTSQETHHHAIMNRIGRAIDQGVHGVICGAWHLKDIDLRSEALGVASLDIVCPAVRMECMEHSDGHFVTSPPEACIKRGVTHAVVGRPIWKSSESELTAKRYLEALR